MDPEALVKASVMQVTSSARAQVLLWAVPTLALVTQVLASMALVTQASVAQVLVTKARELVTLVMELVI